MGQPGLAAPESAEVVDATGMLMHPGLINGHTHGHGNLAKGMGDRWSLELLLNAAPWIGGGRELEDKYLTTLIGAAEMLLKGCTAAYDLSFEFPAPTTEGVAASAKAYKDAGMRCGPCTDGRRHHLLRRHSGPLRRPAGASAEEIPGLRLAPAETTLERIKAVLEGWDIDTELGPPGRCADHPASLLGCAS